MQALFAWWPEFRKSKVGIAGLIIVIGMVVLILLAPVIATHGPSEKDISIGWNGGGYWTAPWTHQGSSSITSDGGPYNDSLYDEITEYHALLQSDGYIKRPVDLSNALETAPKLQFQAKAKSCAILKIDIFPTLSHHPLCKKISNPLCPAKIDRIRIGQPSRT